VNVLDEPGVPAQSVVNREVVSPDDPPEQVHEYERAPGTAGHLPMTPVAPVTPDTTGGSSRNRINPVVASPRLLASSSVRDTASSSGKSLISMRSSSAYVTVWSLRK
jgi:hypothetical protein